MAAVALAAAAVALGACGSSDDSSTATSTGASTGASTQAASNAPKGDPIKLGVIAATGTPTYNLPETIVGVKASVDAVNKAGGIDGHPIDLTYCNDKSDPNTAATCARQMVDNGVVAVVGGGTFAGTDTPILAKAGIAQLGNNPSTPAALNSPNVFLFSPGTFPAGFVTAAWAGQQTIPMGIVSADVPQATALTAGQKALAAQAGNPFKASVLVAPTAADMGPQVAGVDSVDGIVMAIGYEQAAQFIQASKGAGQSLQYLYCCEPSKAMTDALGDQQSNLHYVSPFPPLVADSPNPLIKQYIADVKAYADSSGDDDAKASAAQPQATGMSSWLSVQLLKQLIADGTIKAPTREGIMAGLKGAKDIDMQGLIPPWTPNKAGPKGLARASNLAYYLIGYKDGVPTLDYPDPVTAADLASNKVKAPALK
jgi:ABC-type branched-subunit amino acid transport system substrate-binding protein